MSDAMRLTGKNMWADRLAQGVVGDKWVGRANSKKLKQPCNLIESGVRNPVRRCSSVSVGPGDRRRLVFFWGGGWGRGLLNSHGTAERNRARPRSESRENIITMFTTWGHGLT